MSGWEGGVCTSREIEKCVHGIYLMLQNMKNIYYPNLRTITTPKFCSCTWGQPPDDFSVVDNSAFPLLTTIVSKDLIHILHPISGLLCNNRTMIENGKLLFFYLRPIVGKDVAKKICRMFMDNEKQITTKKVWYSKEYHFTIQHISGESQCASNNTILVGLLECNEKLNKIIENL